MTLIAITAIAALTFQACSATATATDTGVKPYTSDECIVTDNELGSMGDPIIMVHEGQEVKFCCKPCVKKFKRNPAKYLAKL